MRTKTTLALVTAAQIALFAGCGKKDEDKDEDEAASDTNTVGGNGGGAAPVPTAPELATTEAAVGYALNALSSAVPGTTASLWLDEAQSTAFPKCSNNGAPWDETTGQRMQPSHERFAERTFTCQLTSNESPETVRGAFDQNKRILCDMERILGKIDYTPEGKSYATKISITAACGWPQKTIDEVAGFAPGGFDATVVATSYASGAWQKSIKVTSQMINFHMFITASASTVAFKQVDSWKQSDRDGGDQNASLPADAEGTSGGLVAIDVATGTLRAELFDTYWGRRTRMYVRGVMNATTGAFTSITEGSGLQGNFDISSHDGMTSLYGEVASVKGTETGGFKFNAVQYNCHASQSCLVASETRAKATVVQGGSFCSVTGGCAGEPGIALEATAADYDFWMVGEAWKTQGGNSAAAGAWMTAAGLPTFTTVDKTPLLP